MRFVKVYENNGPLVPKKLMAVIGQDENGTIKVKNFGEYSHYYVTSLFVKPFFVEKYAEENGKFVTLNAVVKPEEKDWIEYFSEANNSALYYVTVMKETDNFEGLGEESGE